MIIREISNKPMISIPYTEIISIVKDDKGNFEINGRTSLDTIEVSYLIENYEQLEIELSQIKTIETVNKTSYVKKYRIPFLLLAYAFMAAMYISTNNILVVISGTIASIILICLFSSFIRKVNNNDAQ